MTGRVISGFKEQAHPVRPPKCTVFTSKYLAKQGVSGEVVQATAAVFTHGKAVSGKARACIVGKVRGSQYYKGKRGQRGESTRTELWSIDTLRGSNQ